MYLVLFVLALTVNANVRCYILALLSSVLNQRPEDTRLERVAQSKYDYCMNRIQALQSSVAMEREASNGTQQARHVMGELYIDNQVKREAASSDYTPLHTAIHRAPASANHRLSRTDSQISNGSAGSTGHRSVTSANSASESGSTDRTVHVVPPKLQHSISQLQQKQQREQTQQHTLQQLPTTAQQPSKCNPASTQYSQHQHKMSVNKLPQPQQSERYPPVHNNPRQMSNGSLEDNRSSSSKPSSGTLYKEVNIPTTLQRMDYIRDGYRARADRQGCVTPSVIPPPKEFQEPTPLPSTHRHSVPNDTRGNSSRATMGKPPLSQHNGTSYNTHSNAYSSHSQAQPLNTQSAQYARSNSLPTHDDYRDLPPKQTINKQNIRDMLVQDMLMRKGQGQPGSTGHSVEAPRPMYQNGSGSAPKQPIYSPQFDEPLWTPPQQSAYERGLSHYDRPNYQRQNLYGQVNAQQPASGRYASNGPAPQSLVSV